MGADVSVRKVRPGDGEAIARMHIDNAAYYHDLIEYTGLNETCGHNHCVHRRTAKGFDVSSTAIHAAGLLCHGFCKIARTPLVAIADTLLPAIHDIINRGRAG